MPIGYVRWFNAIDKQRLAHRRLMESMTFHQRKAWRIAQRKNNRTPQEPNT